MEALIKAYLDDTETFVAEMDRVGHELKGDDVDELFSIICTVNLHDDVEFMRCVSAFPEGWNPVITTKVVEVLDVETLKALFRSYNITESEVTDVLEAFIVNANPEQYDREAMYSSTDKLVKSLMGTHFS